MRRCETVRQRPVLADGPTGDDTDVSHYGFRLAARNRQPHQVVTAPLLKSEVHGAAVRRPTRRTLAVVQDGADFAAVAAVGVHHPNVGVFHGRLAVGQAAAGAAIDDVLAVRGPERLVLAVFSRGQAANAVVRNL